MPDKTIKLRDKRTIDTATGKLIASTSRMHASIPEEYIKYVVDSAKKHGIDPATALAINLQETGFKQDQMHNPFMLGNYNPQGDVIDESMKFLADKIKLAKKLGKKTDEDIIQGWNGYGVIKGKGTMYGIDTNKEPIDMKKNPVYGKRIVNLRDSVIRQNPDIMKIVEKQGLKCGGKKLRRGGKKMAEGGLTSEQKSKLGASILDLLGDTTTGIINSMAPKETDYRDNPLSDQRKRDSLSVVGSVAGTTLKAAGTGMAVAGPIGAAVGGGLGLLTSGLKSIIGAKKRREEREKEAIDWSNNWAGQYEEALSGTGYKHGGLTTEKAKEIMRDGHVHGKPLTKKQRGYFGYIAGGGTPKKSEGGIISGSGTGKSDSISKKVEDGSFIVPTENAVKAIDLGRQYLGWEDNEHANRNYPGTEVKVSDGEVLFTPEEVGILSYNGIDLNKLAPKAENKIEKGAKLAEGTKKPTIEQYVSDWQSKYEGSEDDAKAAYQQEYPGNQNPEEETFMSKLSDYLPEIAGAVQVGAGIAGTIRAGQMPDINVSTSLKKLAAEQRKEAQYGLEPGAKDAMLIQAEKARRDTTNAIVNRGGGSAELMSNLQGILSTTINKKFDIELSDVAEKARKKSEYARTTYGIGEQEFNVQQIALQNWRELQDVNAGLLNAGISNIVGARKLKAEMEAMKKIGSSSPSFIINRT